MSWEDKVERVGESWWTGGGGEKKTMVVLVTQWCGRGKGEQ